MNAIVGLSYILRNSADNPKLIEGLNKIDGAANHLLSIINDILDVSKIEAGELQLEHIDFSLVQLFDSLIFLISEQAKAKNLSIETDFDHVPMWLNGDPMRLKQALLNFVSNAIKFTEKGFIKLSAKVLHASETDLLLKFSVQDSGIGIPEDKLNTLFEAFTQADVSTTRKYGGTGLGLTITRSLAQLMQGEIGVESTPDQGSTFWFTARLQLAHDKMSGEAIDIKTQAETKYPEFKSGITILLVEDNPINLEVAKEILENVGFSVDTAENGRVAVEMVAKNAYQLVLMDMQMPEMDGIEATKVIRQLAGKQALPIIAMTANAFEEDRLACINAGMNDFVTKPVVPANLYSVIKRCLS
jgi:two-component system, sensor histidine kinase and response regulator